MKYSTEFNIGFGPFGSVKENPTSILIKKLLEKKSELEKVSS